ncbi:hypothetical protein [Nocardia farcinica]|uniref:Uncharacterized protein n=1 Tax=Nocardia farcinica (strain IFM 10152) TaxID=247156 RepID=Q5YSF3_NOCFA|nr:hypothetical protein [Nocardia farcinica]BAD58888.1 hypothetical protein NFA_40400 [Nocardia farcinica IFM 10152]
MPKDNRTFITVSVDMDRNPKYAALNDAQKFLIIRAWMHCREFLTDGRVSMPAWRKMGTDRNRKAVLAAGACFEDAEQNCVIFHDYLEHQQSRAEVEASKEKARSAGRKGGLKKAENARQQPARKPTERLAPASETASGNVPELEIEEEITTYVPTASYVSNARETEPPLDEPRTRVDVDGWKLVKTVAAALPQATKTALAHEAAAMLKQGIAADDIRAGLDLWMTKSLGPRQLPHLVADVIRANTPKPANAPHQPLTHHDRKTLGWDDAAEAAKRTLGLVPTTTTPTRLPSRHDRPLLEILSSDPTENIA